jgi:hypothetical protein
VVNTLEIAGSVGLWTGRLNLADNDMVIDYTGASPINVVRDQLASGHAAGSWTGNGIRSSAAALDPTHKGLGYAQSSNVLGGGGTFSGQVVDDTAVLVKFTYLGDADLDGDVDVGDLGRLATSWQAGGDWTEGDFDYNGVVNVNDLGMLATNWQAGVGDPLGTSLEDAMVSLGLPTVSVPEPAALYALLLGGLCAARRRQNCDPPGRGLA